MKKLVRNFLSDRSGNFGILTALMATPLVLAAGSAIDYSMASYEKTSMQAVADSAALAGARIYNGTNAGAAKAAAEAYLRGYAQNLPAGSSFGVGMSGQTVEVAVNGASANAFMGIVGLPSTPIKVASAAIAPMKPKSVTFTPTKAQGYWYKKVSIIVTRAGSKAEEVVGTVIYQPQNHIGEGQGSMTVSPGVKFDLGKYATLILQMEVKKDGCGLGYKANVDSAKTVTCTPLSSGQTGYNASMNYDSVLRTDNPATSHHLYVDKVQMPKNSPSPLDRLLECNQKIEHAWEDGGGFAVQDFYYEAESTCAPDGEFVRLTK